MQRIPQYDKYLSELLAETDESHPDYEDLTKAAQKVAKVGPQFSPLTVCPGPHFTKNRNIKHTSGAKMRLTKNHDIMITSVFERN